MLNQLAEKTNCYPLFNDSDKTYSDVLLNMSPRDDNDDLELLKWKATLNTMATYFRNSDEDLSGKENVYTDEFVNAYHEFNKKYGLFGQKLDKDYNENSPSRKWHSIIEASEFDEIREKYWEEEKRLAEERKYCLKLGMEMFYKYFYDLWW